MFYIPAAEAIPCGAGEAFLQYAEQQRERKVAVFVDEVATNSVRGPAEEHAPERTDGWRSGSTVHYRAVQNCAVRPRAGTAAR